MKSLLTLKEVAEGLNVSKATVYRWVKGNKIPAIVIGSTIRVRPSDLEDLLAKSTSTASHQ